MWGGTPSRPRAGPTPGRWSRRFGSAAGRNRCARTGGLRRQFLVQPAQPGRRGGRKVRDLHVPILAIWRFGLRSQHPPEDDEGSGDERELRRPKQQQTRDLLVLERAIRLIEEMVRERQGDPRD